jgi:chitin disaccharide deacetylase
MQPNPALRRLGFAETDRVAIIHTDDIGMCQASVSAFADLWDFGLVSSGAVMVPCPWFLKAAEYARAHPQADLGVHTTLTSEWITYRWGPISTRDRLSGMLDEEGCFYHESQPAQEHGDPEYVMREIEAQVQRALAMGMHPTHLDTHMGTVACPKYMQGYVQVALKYRLPPMIFRMGESEWMARGLDANTAKLAMMLSGYLESLGMPLLDHIFGLDLGNPDGRLDEAKAAFRNLKPGITHFILHPSKDTPELREICPDWRARAANYETFLSEDLRKYIQSIGIHVIGYRQLQELMPAPETLADLALR